MLKIAVCDDEAMTLQELEKIIRAALSAFDFAYTIHPFLSGKQLLAEAEHFDLIFLDIEMPEMDGIQTGRRLRIQNPNGKIIMATSMVERFKECFKIEAFRFITKPFQLDEITEVFEAYRRTQTKQQPIEVFQNRVSHLFPQRNIQFILAYGGYIELQIHNEWFRKKCSLQKIEKTLDKHCFFRIHKQCIINLYWIQEYQNGEILLANRFFAVSRRRKKAFEKAYMEFDLLYR